MALANSRGKKNKEICNNVCIWKQRKSKQTKKTGKDFSPSAFPWKRVLSIKIKIGISSDLMKPTENEIRIN